MRSNDNGDLVVTKGDSYDVREKDEEGDVRNLGKPVELAGRYFQQAREREGEDPGPGTRDPGPETRDPLGRVRGGGEHPSIHVYTFTRHVATCKTPCTRQATCNTSTFDTSDAFHLFHPPSKPLRVYDTAVKQRL